MKQGAYGKLAATADGSAVSHQALPVCVVGTIGAGDSLTAGYLAARCEGLIPTERLRWGTITTARTIGTHGD